MFNTLIIIIIEVEKPFFFFLNFYKLLTSALRLRICKLKYIKVSVNLNYKAK